MARDQPQRSKNQRKKTNSLTDIICAADLVTSDRCTPLTVFNVHAQERAARDGCFPADPCITDGKSITRPFPNYWGSHGRILACENQGRKQTVILTLIIIKTRPYNWKRSKPEYWLNSQEGQV
jgi:hypothetical protein